MKVSVVGGQETNPLWTSEISNESFGQALSEAITASGLFATVDAGSPEHLLEVVLLSVEQPLAGIQMSVTVTSRWSLISTATNQALWTANIGKTFTGGAFDAFAGHERVKIAMEGAARETIREGLEQIGRLEF